VREIILETLAAARIAMLAEAVAVVLAIGCAYLWLGILAGRV
jgi:hypothetical protein